MTSIQLEVDPNDVLHEQKSAVWENLKLPSNFELSSPSFFTDCLNALKVKSMNVLDVYFFEPSQGFDSTAIKNPQNDRRALNEFREVLSTLEKGTLSPEEKTALVACKEQLRVACSAFCAPVNVTFPLDQVVDSEHALFEEWIKKEGLPPYYTIANFPVVGRGLIALKPFTQGELVFEIPRNLILNLEPALAHPTLGPIFRELLASNEAMGEQGQQIVHEDTILLLFAMHERARPDSRWSSYFDLAPKEYTTLLTFSENDLAELEGTPLVEQAVEAINGLKSVYEALVPGLVARHPDLFPADVYTWQNFLWMQCLLDSRAFEPVIGDRKLLSILPIVDMMNHNPHAQVITPKFDPVSQTMKFVALSDIPAGAQLFLNYGGLQNHELLRHYGYIDPTCPYDTYQIGFEVPEEDPNAARKELLLAHSDLLGHCLRRGGAISEKMLRALRICFASEQEFEKLLEDSVFFQKPISADNEKDVLGALSNTFQCLLANYPTPLEDDRETLAAMEKNPETPIRTKFAVEYRVLQKEILTDALMTVLKKLQDIDDQI